VGQVTGRRLMLFDARRAVVERVLVYICQC
jgi:hypothetical protein